MTTLYLVRHGETKDNIAKIPQGQREGELTPVGIVQMEQLASLCLAFISMQLFPAICAEPTIPRRFLAVI